MRKVKFSKYKVQIFLILLIVVVVGISILIKEETTLSINECEEIYNGREVNTLGGETCSSDEVNYGEISGLRCPCICCGPAE